MKKLIVTLALILSTLAGGAVALAPSASADVCTGLNCPPPSEPACGLNPCPPPACGLNPCPTVELGGWDTYAAELAGRVATLEQTANDYRAQVAALTAQVSAATARADRLQLLADQRAATIQRLRAKIRALR